MKRSFISVILGGFGGEVRTGGRERVAPGQAGLAEDAAYMMKNASKIIIVPAYAMAVAQARTPCARWRHPKKEGVEVKYAIHPSRAACPAI